MRGVMGSSADHQRLAPYHPLNCMQPLDGAR